MKPPFEYDCTLANLLYFLHPPINCTRYDISANFTRCAYWGDRDNIPNFLMDKQVLCVMFYNDEVIIRLDA